MAPARPMSWRRLLYFALVTGLLVSGVRAQPSSDAYSANAVRAAFLVNFIRFTEWPASPSGATDAPMLIGVAGNRDLEDYLWRITDGKLLHGRRVRILRLTVPSDATACHLIYINPFPSRADAVPVSTEEWLHAVRDRPVLTVSQTNNFLRDGGIINFYTEGQNLHFEIAADAVEAVGLKMSSRLLALARVVRTKPVPAAPAR